MNEYLIVPKSGHAPVEVATGTGVKTLLQCAVPSSTDIRLLAWGISFDGTSPSAAPTPIVVADFDVAATVTALTPEKYGSADLAASLCVSGTSATGYNATAEGTIGDSRFLDVQDVHPQSGYAVWLPRTPKIKASRFLRMRVHSAAADVNCIPWFLVGEPA